MRRSLSIWLVCAAAISAPACASEPKEADPPEANASKATSIETPVAYANPSTRIRFDLPSKSVEVQRRSFDPEAPPGKVKERFELRQAGRLLVRIDAWTNAENLDAESWIDTYASYLNKGGTRFEQRQIGRGRLPAVIADTPTSCQAPNVMTAIFVVEQKVVAVTCRDGEDPEAKRAFETVLGSFAMEATR